MVLLVVHCLKVMYMYAFHCLITVTRPCTNVHTHSTQTNGSSNADSTVAAMPPGVHANPPNPPSLPFKPNKSSPMVSKSPPPIRPKPSSLRRPAVTLKPTTAPKPVIVVTDDGGRRQGTVYGEVDLKSGNGEVRDSVIDEVAYVTVRRHQT